jgi:hypothetical protein
LLKTFNRFIGVLGEQNCTDEFANRAIVVLDRTNSLRNEFLPYTVFARNALKIKADQPHVRLVALNGPFLTCESNGPIVFSSKSKIFSSPSYRELCLSEKFTKQAVTRNRKSKPVDHGIALDASKAYMLSQLYKGRAKAHEFRELKLQDLAM